MMPRPTAASAAATAITNTTKTWPIAFWSSFENATRLMFTAFRISSIDMKMMMMLRRTITPMTPIMNSAADNNM
jgi:hypothetical protein